MNHPQLCAEIREILQEEARRLYALILDKYRVKAAEDTLLDVFRTDFEIANIGLKNACCSFVENLLTKLAVKEAIDGVLDRNVEKLIQSFSLMD